MILKYLQESFDHETILAIDILDERVSNSNGVQPWCSDNGCDKDGNMCSNSEMDHLTTDEWYDLAVEYSEPMLPEFERILKRFSGLRGSYKLPPLKPRKSFVSKVDIRGKSPCGIHDMIRGAILLPDDIIDKVIKEMRKKLKIFEFEEKAKGDDKEFGYYGTYHFKIELSNGELAEIQVMPRRMWDYKKQGHKVYSRNREDVGKELSPEREAEYKKDQALSKKLFDLGNKKYFKKNRKKDTKRNLKYKADKY